MEKKRGRPSKYDEINLAEVEKLAGLGLTDKEMAQYIGIALSTFSDYKDKHEDFSDTLKRGKVKADMKVVSSLYSNAINGNTTAQIFWLKNRRPHQWRDKVEEINTDGLKITSIENIVITGDGNDSNNEDS